MEGIEYYKKHFRDIKIDYLDNVLAFLGHLAADKKDEEMAFNAIPGLLWGLRTGRIPAIVECWIYNLTTYQLIDMLDKIKNECQAYIPKLIIEEYKNNL